MELSDRILHHQLHPLKLTADIAGSLASTWLLWHGHRRAGVATRYALPISASVALLIAGTDLEQIRASRRGRYARAHMTAPMLALRLAGDTVAALGADRRSTRLLMLGAAIIAAGWSRGLVHLRAAATPNSTP